MKMVMMMMMMSMMMMTTINFDGDHGDDAKEKQKRAP